VASRAQRDQALLERLCDEARGAWPGIEVPPDDFSRWVDERSGGDLEAARKHAGDLYLACACARGDVRALAELDRRFLAPLGGAVATIDPSPAFADEVRQVLRRKLLVSDGKSRARIADYTGRGPLGGWLRVAAIRAARDLKRSHRREAPLEGEPADGALARDPELEYLRARHGRELREALQRTLAELPPRERNVLCLYFLDGKSSVAIGAIYQVEGATVRLWLKRLRATILAETKRLLGERLHLAEPELESLIGSLQDDLEVSLSRLLRRTPR
jgi:RNA polymerase sigma-70 factor (ECF subfamily)